MAATWDQVWTQIKAAVKLLEDERITLVSTYLVNEASILAAGVRLENVNAAQFNAGLSAARARANALTFRSIGRALLDPLVLELGRIIKAPEADERTRDVGGCLQKITRYMVDDPDAITPDARICSRQFTRGAFGSFSGTGTGTVYRLTVDEDGIPLEASRGGDVITCRVIQDRQSGTLPGQEVMEFRGRPGQDDVTRYVSGFGSGLVAGTACFTADHSQERLLNPSFSDFGGDDATLPTEINNWTLDSGVITNLEVTQTNANVYRKSNLEPTQGALKVKGTLTISQKLSTRKGRIDQFRPSFFRIAHNSAVGSFTGSIVITIGSKAYTITISAPGADWEVYAATQDKYLYLKNYNTDDLAVTIAVTKTSGAGTYLLIDDIVWREWFGFDGTWMAPVGGRTHFLTNDQGTITDTEVGSKIQRAVSQCYDYSLPCAPAAPTGTIAVALAGAGAGNIENGAHTYGFTYVDVNGLESALSVTAVLTVVDKTTDGKGAVSAIAVGPTGTQSRKVYRSTTGTTTPLKLLTTVADNVTTTYADDTADASLGANSPGGASITDPA